MLTHGAGALLSLAYSIGLVPFAPLGRGFLTGTARRADEHPEGDFRRNDPRYQGANFDANVRAARTGQLGLEPLEAA